MFQLENFVSKILRIEWSLKIRYEIDVGKTLCISVLSHDVNFHF